MGFQQDLVRPSIGNGHGFNGTRIKDFEKDHAFQQIWIAGFSVRSLRRIGQEWIDVIFSKDQWIEHRLSRTG